jgi:hypothetical protein
MVAPLVIPLIYAAAVIGSAIIGYFSSKGQTDKAHEIMQEAMRRYGNIEPPTLEKVAAEILGPTAYAAIQQDPIYRQAKYEALSRLKQVEDQGGYTLEDRATQAQAMNAAARATAGLQSRVAEDMATRGIGGSGAEIALMNANAQSGADRASQVGLTTAAQAQRRYLDSILERGQLAGQYAAQDWNQKTQVAAAQDAIARFNTESRERAKYYNASLPQQQFANQMALAAAENGQDSGWAQYLQQQGLMDRQMWAGIGQGVGYGASAAGNYLQNNQAPAATTPSPTPTTTTGASVPSQSTPAVSQSLAQKASTTDHPSEPPGDYPDDYAYRPWRPS